EPQPRRLGSRFASDPSDTSSDPGPSPTCSQVLSSRFSGSRPRPVSLCSAGCFASDGGFGVEAFVEVGLEQSAAFAAEWGSAAGWVELEGLGVDDLVGPAAFMDLDVVERAEEFEVVLGGGTAVDVMLPVVGFAAPGRPVAAGEQATAV